MIFRKAINCCADRNAFEENSIITPGAWDESFGGPKALLRAAQEADEDLLKKIATHLENSGICDIDVNVVDISGRVSEQTNFIIQQSFVIIPLVNFNAL